PAAKDIAKSITPAKPDVLRQRIGAQEGQPVRVPLMQSDLKRIIEVVPRVLEHVPNGGVLREGAQSLCYRSLETGIGPVDAGCCSCLRVNIRVQRVTQAQVPGVH